MNPELFPTKEISSKAKNSDKPIGIRSLDVCTDPRSAFFIQYTCQISEEDAKKKYEQLQVVATLTCCVAILYTLTIQFLKNRLYYYQKMYDLQTTTAGDFSVEIDITHKMIQTFYEEEKNRKNQGK